MSLKKSLCRSALGLCALSCGWFGVASSVAETGAKAPSLNAPPLIRGKIDETRMVAMEANVHPAARAENDRGAVADSLPMNHMTLLMRRTPEREAALEAYMESAQTKGSPNFHKWLTAEDLGSKYGPNSEDIQTVTGWLQSHGFTVSRVSKSGMIVDFSGSAGQVLEAFGTEIHNLEVKGAPHIGNLKTAQIPAALAPAVAGIASLNDFQPKPGAVRAKPSIQAAKAASGPLPALSTASGYELLTPADFAAIYNISPLYKNGYTGNGVSVVAVEPTDLYSEADVEDYRKAFVPQYETGSFHLYHPLGCDDPHLYGPWEFEAIVDVESIMASAPGARVEVASCASSNTNFGSYIALQNVIDLPTPPPIISISVESCEAGMTQSGNEYISDLYQQAAAEGTSVYVSSSDSGAAGCDDFDTEATATYGISVNGLASTAYNVAVGGTDFADTYLGTNTNFWSDTNGPTYGSATKYIPEIPWNDSCASTLISHFVGYAVPYGPNGFCNSNYGQYFQNIVAGSGGPSGCATGETNPNPNTPAVSGTCAGRPKPSWQKVVGVPNDGVRDLPDVSLFAANGTWGHYYVFCFSDTSQGGTPCTGDPSTWGGGGGTSASAPLMAGIQALVNQFHKGLPQGNPNYVFYSLARAQYGAKGNTACDSMYGHNTCAFHDVTLGDDDVDCTGTFNCYAPGGGVGVLSVSDNSYQKAYGTGLGWDFATGIGTLNASSLVLEWDSAE
jgi:subtilase family serine protease